MDLVNQVMTQSLEVLSLESRFHDTRWLTFTLEAIGTCVPMEFFTQPASSSGKYHQGYELGLGGLVRHTVAVMEIARTLFPLYSFTEDEEDSIISALCLHDIAKPSRTHPIEAKLILEPIRDKYPTSVRKVCKLIETHHGQWDYFGKMPRPISEAQKFVHLCDYLGSRKNIAVDINYKEEET